MIKFTAHSARPRHDACLRTLLMALFLGTLSNPQTLPAQMPPPVLSPGPGQTVNQWLATLRNQQAERPDRLAAASRLLAACEDADTARQVTALLAPNAEDPTVRTIILEAAAKKPILIPAFLPTFAELAAAATPEELPLILAATGSIRTPEAAQHLATFLADTQPATVRQAALAALVRLSSREDLAQDGEALATWLESLRRTTPGEWAAALIRDLAARADRLAADRETLIQQHVALLRRHYQDQALETRQQLIAEMLRHPRDEVRSLGFELARAELERTPRLDGQVSTAAIELLRDRNPRWRERAAALLDQLAPPDAGPAVVDALNRETDSRTAAALLTAATRWPTIATIPTTLRWLEAGQTTRRAAALLALALIRQGLLTDPVDLARIATALRAAPQEQLGSVTLRLLMTVGDHEDHSRIAAMLSAADSGQRQAAAVALAERPEGLEYLLPAAHDDPTLFEISLTAITAHRPTAQGFDALANAAAPSPEIRTAALLRLAANLPIPDLVQVAQRNNVPADMKVAMLLRLTDPAMPVNGPHAGHALLGLVMLAEAQMELRRPDQAVIAIDAAARFDMPPDSEQASRLRDVRAIVLIADNRLDDAAALNPSIRAWLEALAHVIDEPFAHDIAAWIRHNYADAMTPHELATLAELERAIPDRPQRSTEPPPHDAANFPLGAKPTSPARRA